MLDEGAEVFLDLKEEYGVYGGTEIASAIEARQLAGGLDGGMVKGLIQARTVNILVGDSGIGKSPLTYQLALAVATGTPFLGIETRQAKVLLIDYENPLPDAYRIVRQLSKHLGISRMPFQFQLWPYFTKLDRNEDTRAQVQEEEVERVVRQLAPDLVILDSLRSHCPAMENDNAQAVRHIRRLRRLAGKNGTAFLFVHHVRKQRTRNPESLEHAPVLDWLIQSAGARALINQTDTRLAISTLPKASEDVALILRGNARTHGDIGPYLLRRVYGDDGEPLGYEQTAAAGTPEQEALLERLPDAFEFLQFYQMMGVSRVVAHRHLHRLLQTGLVAKVGWGKYCKTACVQRAA